VAVNKKEKIRAIYELLPKLNCGFCGFCTCGQFARAVAEGRASPFGCRQNPWSGYRLSEITRLKVPAYGYRFQPAFLPGLRASPATTNLKTLKEEVKGLSQEVGDILARIQNLKLRRRNGE